MPENKRRAVDILASIFEPGKGENVAINRSQEQIEEDASSLL